MLGEPPVSLEEPFFGDEPLAARALIEDDRVHTPTGPGRTIAGQRHKLGQGDFPAEDLRYQPRLMDEALWEMAQQNAYGSLGLEDDPELPVHCPVHTRPNGSVSYQAGCGVLFRRYYGRQAPTVSHS